MIKCTALKYLLLGLIFFTTACGGSSGSSGDSSSRLLRCAMREPHSGDFDVVRAVLENRDAAELGRFSSLTRDAGSVLVPVYFHVITGGSPERGAVTDEQIFAQMDVLNQGFAGGRGGVNTPFRFQLAGISRVDNPAWFNFTPFSAEERDAKQSLRIGDATALNVYTLEPQDGILGWASFPWDYEADPVLDGAVIHFASVPGGSLAPFNGGITLVHEVGHWQGLFHTFQGGCSDPGDLVADTAPERVPAFGCPVGKNTCPGTGPDAINNFMNYSDDSCLLEFSPIQSGNMDILSETFRQL